MIRASCSGRPSLEALPEAKRNASRVMAGSAHRRLCARVAPPARPAGVGKTADAIASGEKALKLAKAMPKPPNTDALEKKLAEWKAKK